MPDLIPHRRRVDALLADHRVATARQAEETAAVARGRAAVASAAEAQALAQTIAAGVQGAAVDALARVVSRCLAAVFVDDPYEFNIRFESKRGKTEAVLEFTRDGYAVDPLDASGGGVVDVASFALRIAALCLSRPRKRLLVVADEPFRFVSAQYRPAVRVLLEQLAAEFEIQFLIITHIEELRCGAVVEVG